MQVFAHLQLPETHHALLMTGGVVPDHQELALPSNWTHLRTKHDTTCVSTGKALLQDAGQLAEADMGIADLVRGSICCLHCAPRAKLCSDFHLLTHKGHL